MRRRVLILQNDASEGPGRLPVALTEAAAEYDVVHAYQDGVPVDVTHDALVVLGGPQSVDEHDTAPYLRHEQALIRAYAARTLPVLGICLGAQLAAAAFGGTVFRGDVYEAGWGPVIMTAAGRADPVAARLQAAPAVYHFHGDTYTLPPGAVRLCSTDAVVEQGFRLGSVLAFQFHVEVTQDMGKQWIDAQRSMLESRGCLAPVETPPPGTATALDRVLDRVALFLDGHRDA